MLKQKSLTFLVLAIGAAGLISALQHCGEGQRKDVPLELPPFEQEVFLSLEAHWGEGDCVDVETTTNLPSGTIFVILAGILGTVWDSPSEKDAFAPGPDFVAASEGPRMVHRGLFCGFSRKVSPRCAEDLAFEIRVEGGATSPFLGHPFDPRRARLSQLIGPHGEQLRGALVSRLRVSETESANAISPRVILKARPCGAR